MGIFSAGDGIIEELQALERRVGGLERAALRESLAGVIADVRRGRGTPGQPAAVTASLGLCRTLWRHARSAEALSLARVAYDEADHLGDPRLALRAATACGILSADTLDVVGAIEHHVLALRLATEAGDAVEASRTWNNLGLAMGLSGHYELAARCYRRAVELVAAVEGPVYSRYTAWMNLAHCLHRAGAEAEGLPYAFLAMEEETPEFRAQDPLLPLFLRRNLVRLLVACGRAPEGEEHVAECIVLARGIAGPRATIALATTLGTYELALGKVDVALTRLEGALALAREVPAALHDTLVTVIRAEEAAGHVERALIRLDELTEHVYRRAIERAREHVELAALDSANGAVELARIQAKARLVAKISPPSMPDAWQPLERLSLNAVMRMDASGLHGKRVGALVKALARANGAEPLQALEMGLAAELHDIGMLSVPEEILGKSDALSDAERGIVRRHVNAGVEMLGDDRHPRVFIAREIARYHHARWDGEGEPAIGGKRIPIAARACAVADAYDAMVCGVGGTAPRSMEHALSELRAEAGGQFDPGLVEDFDRIIRTEGEDLGVDLASSPGMREFQSLVNALQQDRGFV